LSPSPLPAGDGAVTFSTPAGDASGRRDYAVVNQPIGDSLLSILRTSGPNYAVALPRTDKTVTLELKNATVEEALRAVLRQAGLPQRYRTEIATGAVSLSPIDNGPGLVRPDALRLSGAFAEMPVWDAINSMGHVIRNYTLDEALKKCVVTLAFKERTIAKLFKDIEGVASPPITTDFTGGLLKVRAR